MKRGKTAKIFRIGMLAGGLPCSAAILLFIQLMLARKAGRPMGGDGLGIMMISLVAYALALLSCVTGLIYFAFARFKYKEHPQVWDWFGIVYSAGQLAVPLIYLALT
jgi:hypothetical protein